MKRFFSIIIAVLAISVVANAQDTSKEVETLITSTANIEFSWTGGTAIVPVKANNDYTITLPESEWLTAEKAKNSIILKAKATTEADARSLTVTIATANGKIKRSFQATQEGDRSVESVSDTEIAPKTMTASSAQGGETIDKMFDKDASTLWHSSYAGGVSANNPVTLTFTFDGTKEINYISYIPRSSGTNGNWLAYSVAVTAGGKTTTTNHTSTTNAGPQTINLAPETNPTKIVITITQGAGGYASGAEMGFYKRADISADTNIFADDIYSKLKEGTTQADIDALTNPFCKNLAQTLYNGDYDTNYRVNSFPCRLSYSVLSDEWNAPGKYYSQLDNPTGINFCPNDYRAVIVSGLPEDITASLAIVAWYVGKDGGNFDGGNPHTTYYTLHNGINTIDYKYEWAGLGYIQYYAQTRERFEQGVPDVKVHFVNGRINGILTPDKTNEEMLQICKTAAQSGNVCLDVYGNKVQSVWTSAGLRDYCKASDGKALGYRQFMNVLDSLIQWEHRELGLEKYNRIPNNHTFAYTNYTYYMFQGGLGVSFHHNQESRVLNCRTLMYNDDDAIWGLSHEWGHQHQMTPYMCWSGLSEVSNNIFSYFNVMHMGYTYTRGGWGKCIKYFLDNAYPTAAGESGLQIGYFNFRATSKQRQAMYNAVKSSSSLYSFSTGLRNQCLAEEDSMIYRYSVKPQRSLSLYDAGVGEILGAFILPGNFAKLYINRHTKEWSKDVLVDDGYLDFYPDLFEAMRQSDDVAGDKTQGGSMIEKQDGYDKYELICSAQNSNKNHHYTTLRQKFPESIWANESSEYNYLNRGNVSYQDNSVPAAMNFVRKASRLMGYNLFPFFDAFGMFRIGAWQIGDYGTKRYIVTQEMYDEFKADMDALVADGTIKEMPEGMVEAIFNCRDLNASKTDRIYPTPEIAN